MIISQTIETKHPSTIIQTTVLIEQRSLQDIG